MRTLSEASLEPRPDCSPAAHGSLVAWNNWETALRNKIATLRRAQFKSDPQSFLRREGDFFSEIDKIVQEAFSLDDPLAREKELDAARWRRLDEIESKGLFSFPRIFSYRLKLLMLEKWSSRTRESGGESLEKILDAVFKEGAGAESPAELLS